MTAKELRDLLFRLPDDARIHVRLDRVADPATDSITVTYVEVDKLLVEYADLSTAMICIPVDGDLGA